jgi:hypothetical protein
MTSQLNSTDFFSLDMLNLEPLFRQMEERGAVSHPLLAEDFRQALLEEAGGYTYQPEEEVVGSGERTVRQQMGTLETFPAGSRYLLLRDAFQELMDRSLAALPVYPFQSTLTFNSLSLQKYEPGSIGITPHLDSLRYINLICLFVIGGQGRFFVCTDRSGRDSIEIDAAPGNLILMRAPGFMGSQARPFHYVTEIPETRYSFGLRQKMLTAATMRGDR